jgi:integrase
MRTNGMHYRFNPFNERVKFNYRRHLSRVGQKDEKTVKVDLRRIRDFEIFIDFEGFETFNDEIAHRFVDYLLSMDKSLSYVSGTLRAVKDFLTWLERQRGYRSKIDYNHIAYLSLTRNQLRTAKSKRYQKAYSFDDIVRTIRQMPHQTDRQLRDKALISIHALTNLRISELRTIKISSIIEEDGVYFLDVCPRVMKVKFAKARQVVFLALPEDIKENVMRWKKRLTSLGYKKDDPLFPAVDNSFNAENLLEDQIRPNEIKSDSTIRNIFKKAFENAGLEYINPHSFRNTIARHAQKESPQYLNAIRQNLGHSSIDTTLNSYGQLSVYDQHKTISNTKLDF